VVVMVVTMLAVAFGVAAAGVAVMAAVDWWRRERSAAFRVIAFVGAAIALSNGLSLAQLMAPRPGAFAGLVIAQTVLLPITAAGVVCMSLVHSDRAWRLTRTVAVLLSATPVVMAGAAVTPAGRDLIVGGVRPVPELGVLLPVPGPLYWVCVSVIQVLLVGSAIRIFVLRRRATSAEQRRICNHALITYLFPIAVAFLGGALPLHGIDVIPIGQALCMVYVHVAWIGRMSRQMPVAHRTIFTTISDAVLVADPDGRVIEANPAAVALLRRFRPDIPDDLTEMTVTELGDLELDRRNATEQTLVDLHLQINPVHDRRDIFLGWVLVGRDLTESNQRRRRAEEDAERLREQLETIQLLQANLAEQARRDALTGLPNRRHLMETLTSLAAEHAGMSLAVIDLDHFKAINDAYGHAGGDVALVHTAQLLAAAVRDGDLVARYGGEEFVVVFQGVSPETAWSRIDALRERLAASPIELGGQAVAVTMSAGVASTTAAYDVDDLLRQADEAMYAAKRLGRNRTELHGLVHH
jgi:diguanylate cyclase (GGDEF)-like protein